MDGRWVLGVVQRVSNPTSHYAIHPCKEEKGRIAPPLPSPPKGRRWHSPNTQQISRVHRGMQHGTCIVSGRVDHHVTITLRYQWEAGHSHPVTHACPPLKQARLRILEAFKILTPCPCETVWRRTHWDAPCRMREHLPNRAPPDELEGMCDVADLGRDKTVLCNGHMLQSNWTRELWSHTPSARHCACSVPRVSTIL